MNSAKQNRWEGGVCEGKCDGVRLLALHTLFMIICCLAKRGISRKMLKEDLAASEISQERPSRTH